MSRDEVSALYGDILRSAFHSAIIEEKIPESQWRQFAEQMVRDFTGTDAVDPDFVEWIIRKSGRRVNGPAPPKYLDHKLECPYCLTIRLRIPDDARPETPISCDDCGEYLGTWDELQTDFEKQGGQNGVFRLEKGRIQRIR
ncbi:hypothetical protein RFN25_29710 [Mesorhizobium abyssinicae]|uniref:Uncharacterized protein n=1 Tax=Mesorhizobium abyssinicae TaxID=1209958 RepID=A0ABU5AXC6_9HYPH|nr:hypothetical protein [Mesorhizobium abyssinicae]MDX8437587.1 hypothetical protein [Mesorhizobium abyssinicae]MDX8541949.1 hypothetical protein [Mesorhizobium abyssinicae]